MLGLVGDLSSGGLALELRRPPPPDFFSLLFVFPFVLVIGGGAANARRPPPAGIGSCVRGLVRDSPPKRLRDFVESGENAERRPARIPDRSP